MIPNELPSNNGCMPLGIPTQIVTPKESTPQMFLADHIELRPMMMGNQLIKYTAGNVNVARNNMTLQSPAVNAAFPNGNAFMVGFWEQGQQMGIATDVDFGPRLSQQQVNALVTEFQTEVDAFLALEGRYTNGGQFAAGDFIRGAMERVYGDLALQENFRVGQLMQIGSIRHALQTGFMTTGFLKTHISMPDIPLSEKVEDHIRIAEAFGRFGRLVGAFSVFKREYVPILEGVEVVAEILSHEHTQNHFYAKDDVSGIDISPEVMIHAYEMMVNAEKHARNSKAMTGLNVTMQVGFTDRQNQEYVQIVIYDNVPSGLDPDVAREMFTKGKSTSGTLGLGLFEAHREVTAMGGVVRAVDLRSGISYFPSTGKNSYGIAEPEMANEAEMQDLVLSMGNTTAFIIELPLDVGTQYEP